MQPAMLGPWLMRPNKDPSVHAMWPSTCVFGSDEAKLGWARLKAYLRGLLGDLGQRCVMGSTDN
jgi:hypothetical protein